jgi:hypothetical protein
MKFLEITALLVGMTGGLVALKAYVESVEQQKIENRLSIFRDLTPSVGVGNIEITILDGFPAAEVHLTNNSRHITKFVNLGANYYWCNTGQKIATSPENPVVGPAKRQTLFPLSSDTLVFSSDPNRNELIRESLNLRRESFVVEFVISISLEDIEEFQEFVTKSDFSTEERFGFGNIVDRSVLSQVYLFSGSYIETEDGFVASNDLRCITSLRSNFSSH